jgi:phosphatidylserine decarboxylase
MNSRLFIGLQHLLPQHFLTSLVYSLTRSRSPWLKNALISNFVTHFKPDMSDAVQPNPLAYDTFNEFFTRALRPDARPIAPDLDAIVSPVDGMVSQIGTLEGSRLLQAKGIYYSLESLLGGHEDEAAGFVGGSFATLYLAPFNYHRIHMPLAGTLRAAWYVPGSLFSVNATTAASVAGLFARNERVVCVFGNSGLRFAMILVGALFVGSMETVWHGTITPRHPRVGADLASNPELTARFVERGVEMGRFNMGSTVILLFPPGMAQWSPELGPGSTIRVGQAIAQRA